jgi:hypothetical protein
MNVQSRVNMVETRNPTIERAITIATREREITADEREAFERFRSRLHDIQPIQVSPTAKGTPAQAPLIAMEDRHQSGGGAHVRSTTQQQVIDAYRETVVALDNYDEAYGNPIPKDIAFEFGQQAAHALFTESELSPFALEHLVTQAEASLEERQQHARGLNRELDSLKQCDATLGDIETGFAECPPPAEAPAESVPVIHEELHALEQRCEKLVTRRQELLQSRPSANFRSVDEQSLNRYLYAQQLPVVCPVLHDTVTISRRIQAHCERYGELSAEGDSVDDLSVNGINRT